MYSTRLVHVLMVALSVTSVTGVAWLNPHHGGYEVKRQDDTISIGTDLPTDSTAADPTSSTTDDPPSSSTTPPDTSVSETPTSTTSEPPTSTPTSTSTTADNTSPTSADTTPTSTNGPTTIPPTSTPTSGSPTSTPTSTSTSTGGEGGDETSAPASTTVAPVTSTFVFVTTTTDAAGQTFVTSSSSTFVTTPTADPDRSSQPSGMEQGTKNIIIGVCVGVGGAIILAAAGVLFWRLRSKRRNQDESEELVSYGDGFSGPGAAEKPDTAGSPSARTPFQSTLESYHAPTQTNAASNF
ncbi:hypothetical protein F4818DRAFT_402972 [Hypoxylon cercidicola]|nr:hypothetical protein F4818DRAFT_402972 [Hypoxylon cercidicola]